MARRYVPERELGRGGMAAVFLARDLRYDRLVALKALQPEVAALVGADRFLREIRIVSQLSHPNIVGLMDSGVAEADGFAIPWYVMPYVEGETLRERLRREGQLPVEDAVRIATDVAEALAYAHGRGVIHRDVKPENVLLQGERALVADFGIARLAGRRKAGGTISSGGVAVGTPHYMSPEQWDADPRLDGRCDLYSLGCVFYEMLIGEPPFTGATVETVAARHRSQPPPPLRVVRAVPPHLEAVVHRALAKLPADRFQTADQFREALTGAAPPSAGAAWPSGRRWILAGLGVAVAAAVVIRFLIAGGGTPFAPEATDIAVLPIADEVRAPRTNSLAVLLTERLVARLDSVRGIRVRSLEVTRPLMGLPLDSILRRTRAGTAVSGTLSGDEALASITVRVNASGTPEYPIGLQTWSRAVQDVIPLADSLAGEIARYVLQVIGRHAHLGERLGGLPRGTRALVRRARALLGEGYHDYLAGDPLAATWKLLRADTLLARAEERQGRSAIATVDRGWVAQTMAHVQLRDDPARWRQWMDSSVAHATRALRRAPEDPWALELRGTGLLLLAEFLAGEEAVERARAAETDLRSALSRNDSLAGAWAALSRIRLLEGDFEQAAAYADRALEVDPFLREGRLTLTTLFNAELGRERFDAAGRVCERGRQLYPGDPNFLECRLQILAWSGRTETDAGRAWEEVERLEAGPGGHPALRATWGWRRLSVAAVLARAGLRDSAWRLVRAVKARDSAPGDLMEARLYALLGETDLALVSVERVLRSQPAYRGRIAAEPWFRGMREEPRFQGLVD